MDIINELKSRADLVEIIGKRVTLNKKGNLYTGLCPFHQEKTPSFTVYPNGTWHCFGCHKGGDVISFIQEIDNKSFPEVIKELGDQFGIEVGHKESEERVRNRAILAEAKLMYISSLKKHPEILKYLNDRVTEKGVQLGELGYAPPDLSVQYSLLRKGYTAEMLIAAGLARSHDSKLRPFFWDRIMIPIHNKMGQVCGFGARVLPGKEGPKFINSPAPAFEKGSMLYGMQWVDQKAGNITVVEGYFDALACAAKGYRNTVAVMGTALTDQHIRGLRGKLIIALDSDNAGKEATLTAAIAASANPNLEIRCAILPDGKDPDDIVLADQSVWQRTIDGAEPAIEYLVKVLAGGKQKASAEERSTVARAFLPYWNAVDDITRSVLADKLAVALGVGSASLQRWFNKESGGATTPTKPVDKEEKPRITDDHLLIAAFVRNESTLSCLNRAFRELEIPILSISDFQISEAREIFELVKKWDAEEELLPYVEHNIPEGCTQFWECVLSIEESARKEYVSCALNMRTRLISFLLKEATDEHRARLRKELTVIDSYRRKL